VVLDFYHEAQEEVGGVLFEQDKAPSHTTKATIKYLKQHDIETLPQPPCSPDVVSIKSLWHTLKEHIHACPCIPTNLQELKVTIKEVWDLVIIDEVNKHIDCMHDQVVAVLEAKGGHMKY
jgi:transposase